MATTNPLMAFGSKLNQEILTAADFDPNRLNDPDQIEDFATILEVNQPLVNLDGIYQRKAARQKWMATEKQLERTVDGMQLKVAKTYMELQLAHQTLQVLQTTQKVVKENEKMAQDYFDQGMLQKADVLAVSVRATEVANQLQYAKSQIANTSDLLKELMGMDQEGQIIPLDSLQAVALDSIGSFTESRADILAVKDVATAYGYNHKADKMGFLPRLNAFGRFEMHDDQIFQADASGYLFGAQLSWNVFDGAKRIGKKQHSKAAYEKASIQYEQYVDQSRLEYQKALRAFDDAQNNVNLARLAMEQSGESLRIRTNRFKEGLEKTTDLLLADMQYANKQLAYHRAIYGHNLAQEYLIFLTKTYTQNQ
jgi:outer membrane protein TolC